MFKALPGGLLFGVIIGAYAVVILIAILFTPLALQEMLQLIATTQQSFAALIGWMAITPAAAPLFYFSQYPFVALFGHAALAARLPSLLFALCSCWLFFKLAMRVPVQQPYLALLLFLLLPIHLEFSTKGLPQEEAMLLMLLATGWFFRVIEQQTVTQAVIYGALLTGCLYADPFSYLSSVGYLLFLFAFAKDKFYRRAVWFVLPATVVSLLLFLPYYFWTHDAKATAWLYGPGHFALNQENYLAVFRELSAPSLWGYLLSYFLLVGAVIGGWRAIKLPAAVQAKKVRLFCLSGGVVSTIGIALILDVTSGVAFSANQVFWAAPAFAILFTATLDWFANTLKLTMLARTVAIALLLLCVAGDAEYLGRPPEDLNKIADLAAPELADKTCVVYVSEGLSKPIWTLFRPELNNHECADFFPKRIVLLSHPWVRPEQQQDAESVFRALNYAEKKRLLSGNSKAIVLEEQHR